VKQGDWGGWPFPLPAPSTEDAGGCGKAPASSPSPIPRESAAGSRVSRWWCLAKDLWKQLERNFYELFAMQCAKMQMLCFCRLEREFSMLSVFSGKAATGSTAFTCASRTCWAGWQGTAFLSYVCKTFWSLFVAAALYAADSSSRLRSTRGRGTLQRSSALRAPSAPKSRNPSQRSDNTSSCKSSGR